MLVAVMLQARIRRDRYATLMWPVLKWKRSSILSSLKNTTREKHLFFLWMMFARVHGSWLAGPKQGRLRSDLEALGGRSELW